MKRIPEMLLLLAALSPAALSAQTTQKLSATKANDYGLIYNLPATSLKVTVEAQRTVKTPGEFYPYSKKYLSIDPISTPSESWTLKSAVITPEGVADPEGESYLIQFKGGATPFMIVDANSFPITINDEEYTLPAPPALPMPVAAEPTVLERPESAQALTQEMVQSRSTVKRAELAANKIYELRQSRNEIISGQADQMPGDGKAMQLALDNLTGQEQVLTAMFTGTEKQSTEVASFDWLVNLPEGTDQQRIIIARLSQVEGLVAPDDLSGEPIYLDIKVKNRGQLPATEKGEAKRFPKGGLAYCIPGEAAVSIVYQGRTVATANVAVAQLGVVFGLDPAQFTDKKAPAYVRFNPVNGSIVEIGTVR